MRIWLVKRIDKVDYDEYDAAVVCAEDPDSAMAEAVGDGFGWAGNGATTLKCEPIGEAAEGTIAGRVLASFNAG